MVLSSSTRYALIAITAIAPLIAGSACGSVRVGGAGGSNGSGVGGTSAGGVAAGDTNGDTSGAAGSDDAGGSSAAGSSGSAGTAATGHAGTGGTSATGGGAGSGGAPAGGAAGGMTDLCPGGGQTTVSGTVFDPSGQLPLEKAVVYSPTVALDPVSDGAACGACVRYSGQPATIAVTDARGQFVLAGVPAGTDIPFVIQIGKWRREVVVPTVTACTDTALEPALTRLPRTHLEGNIPRIAVVTGNSDALECLLLRIGIDVAEFTTDTQSGRVHMYYGGDLTGPTGFTGTSSFSAGATFASAGTLWSNATKMSGYDIQLYSCEGALNSAVKDPYRSVVEGYMNGGGRVLLSHLQFNWLRNALDVRLPGTAVYIGAGNALADPSSASVDTTSQMGSAFADWLVMTGATPTRAQIDIHQGQHSVSGVTPPTRAWLTIPVDPSTATPAVQLLSFDTPAATAPADQCGRVALADFHMTPLVGNAGGDNSDPTRPFPTECANNGLTPQAKALAFMLFELSNCP